MTYFCEKQPWIDILTLYIGITGITLLICSIIGFIIYLISSDAPAAAGIATLIGFPITIFLVYQHYKYIRTKCRKEWVELAKQSKSEEHKADAL